MTTKIGLHHYYSYKEIAELPGMDLMNVTQFRADLAEKVGAIKHNGRFYWPKETIDFLEKLKQDYYTLDEVAGMLNLHPTTVIKYFTNKMGIKIARPYFYKIFIDNLIKELDTYYTPEESAKILGISSRTFSLKYKEHSIKIFGRVYLRKEFIDEEYSRESIGNLDQYYTSQEVGKILGIGTKSSRTQFYQKRLKPKKFKGSLYYPKDIVNAEREKRKKEKNILKKEETQTISKQKKTKKKETEVGQYYNIMEMKKFGVEYMYLSERKKYLAVLKGKFWCYPKEVIDLNLLHIKNTHLPINKEDYYTMVEVGEKLGRSEDSLTNRMQIALEGIDIGRSRLFPKSVVDTHIDLFKDTIMVKDVSKETHARYKVGIKRLKTLLKENDVQVLKNPLNNISFVKKSDLKHIFKLCEGDGNEFTPYEVYERYKELYIPQVNIPNTIKTLDEYVTKRLSDNPKTTHTIRVSACQIYRFLATRLVKELVEVESAQNNLYIQAMKNDPSINKFTIMEFARFLNYLHKKKIYKVDYTVNKSTRSNGKEIETIEESKQHEPYTEVEYLELWNLVYNKILEPEYLKRVVENRNSAMSCLYIAMHYVTIWRQKDIMKMPYPSIEALGFSTGEDFIKWMQEGNEFTENMGIVMCKDLQLKIQALGAEASKNDRKLTFEFGMTQSRVLGFLLCLCESYRRMAARDNEGKIKQKTHRYVVLDIAKRIFEQDEVLKAELDKVLNGQSFTNRRGNKAYGNYILTKSEEGKFGIGYFIVSVMRSHTLDEKLVSSVTQRYLNPNVNGTIDDISLTLFDRGTLGFAKYQLLSLINPEFHLLETKEQTRLMNELNVKNSDIEKTSQAVQKKKKFINRLITKLAINPSDAKKVLYQIAYGTNCGGHEHTKCLLRAIISANILTEIIVGDLEQEFACLRDNCISCIGCPMLIQEILFMTELNTRILGVLERFIKAESEFDRKMYTELIYEGYMPLLMEIADECSSTRIEQFIDMENVRFLIEEIKSQKKIYIEDSYKKEEGI